MMRDACATGFILETKHDGACRHKGLSKGTFSGVSKNAALPTKSPLKASDPTSEKFHGELPHRALTDCSVAGEDKRTSIPSDDNVVGVPLLSHLDLNKKSHFVTDLRNRKSKPGREIIKLGMISANPKRTADLDDPETASAQRN